MLDAVFDCDSRPCVVVASSARVYAGHSARPLREDDPLAQDGTYGASKAAADRITREAAAAGLTAATVRASNVYGPGDPAASRIVPEIMSCLVEGNEDVQCLGGLALDCD